MICRTASGTCLSYSIPKRKYLPGYIAEIKVSSNHLVVL